jgi:uncharacterized protein YjiS (DUF1127 family)
MRRIVDTCPDALLSDVGLAAEDLWREGYKPFWRC